MSDSTDKWIKELENWRMPIVLIIILIIIVIAKYSGINLTEDVIKLFNTLFW